MSSPPNLVYVRTTFTGDAVDAASFYFPQPVNYLGNLWIHLVSPGMLGAGTHTSSVKFEMCLDSMCEQPVSGSPHLVNVTYVITGSTFPGTQVTWSQNSLTGATITTAETGTPRIPLKVTVTNMPAGGLWVRNLPSTNGIITGAELKKSDVNGHTGKATADFDVYLKPPAALGSGKFNDSMDIDLCFDSACANPVPASKYTVSQNLFIPATEGLEFTRRELPATTSAIGVTWSAANQKLYVATNLSSLKILEMDPLTMATTSSAELETGIGSIRIGAMAVSPDGSKLFVASRRQHFVYRLTLPSLTQDKAISLGDWGSYPIIASDLVTIAGQPESFIVATATNNDTDNGVFVYDDETPRANFVPKNPAQSFGPPRRLIPAATAGTYFSQNYGPSFPQTNTMDLLTVDANGITTTSSMPTGHQFYYSKPVRIGAKMYTTNGRILDAASGAEIGLLPGFGSFVAKGMVGDEARGYLYVWTDVGVTDYILKYDVISEELLAYAPVYGGPVFGGGSGSSMAWWGDEGVAITDGAQILVLSGPFFSTYRGEPTQ